MRSAHPVELNSETSELEKRVEGGMNENMRKQEEQEVLSI
jgi:hypothetical protein